MRRYPDATGLQRRAESVDGMRKPNVGQRTYSSWRQERDGCTVEILSNQCSDGRPVERTIWLSYEMSDESGLVRDDMDAERARVCGELLIAAAEELVRLNT